MAIECSIETPHGATATYWKVAGMQVYYADQLVDLTLFGFVSQAARAAEKQPLATMAGVRLSFSDLGANGGEPTREACYRAIKAKAVAAKDSDQEPLKVFAAAVDC